MRQPEDSADPFNCTDYGHALSLMFAGCLQLAYASSHLGARALLGGVVLPISCEMEVPPEQGEYCL